MLLKNSDGIYCTTAVSSLSYPQDGNDYCFELEAKSFWFAHRNKVIETIIEQIPFQRSFADIGGGNGFQVSHLSEKFIAKEFYLIEPNYSGCVNARKRGVKNVYCSNYEEFGLKEKMIGGIGLFDVIEHINDDLGFLKNLGGSADKGALLYLTTPAYQGLWSDVDIFSGHYRRYTTKSLSRVLEHAGWKVRYTSYFFRYLPLLIWPVRRLPYLVRGRRNEQKIKSVEEHYHTGLFDQMLLRLHSGEVETLKNDKINFGGSIITVAEKL